MKDLIVYGLIAVSLILGIAAFMKISQLNSNIDSLRKSLESKQDAKEVAEEPEEEYEVAIAMNHFQRHANKLWFAGVNENWELAHFYAHELEESMEELEERKVVDDGINVSKMVATMGIPHLEGVEKSIDAGQVVEFKSAYQTLIKGCNDCHAAVNYDFLEITIPTAPVYTNQQYSVQ